MNFWTTIAFAGQADLRKTSSYHMDYFLPLFFRTGILYL